MPGRRTSPGANGSATGACLLIACGFAAGIVHAAATGGTARESGLADLAIVVDDTRLTITLTALARDLTGLDHPPADAVQTAQLAAALGKLHSGDTLFLLPSVAWCRPISATVGNPANGGSPQASIQASWQFQCSAPAALQWIDAHLLAAFPGVRKLRTSATTPAGIKSVVLTAGTPRILLPRAPLPRQ